jgi:hypothetical protein
VHRGESARGPAQATPATYHEPVQVVVHPSGHKFPLLIETVEAEGFGHMTAAFEDMKGAVVEMIKARLAASQPIVRRRGPSSCRSPVAVAASGGDPALPGGQRPAGARRRAASPFPASQDRLAPGLRPRRRGRLLRPFADDDPKIAVIVPKALVLARP